MCTGDAMALWIDDSGASTVEIQRGVAAAQEYLASVNATAETATVEQWKRAELAAFESAFAGWHRWPEAACLVRDDG